MRRHLRRKSTENNSDSQPLLATWLLRLLATHDWAFRGLFHAKEGYQDDDVATFLELPEFDSDNKKFTSKFLKKAIRKQLKYFEAMEKDASIVSQNVDLMATRLTLSSVEQKLLEFAVLVENCSIWGDLFRNCKIETEQKFYQMLATTLDLSLFDIRESLSKRTILRQAGLLNVSRNYYEEGKFDLLDELQDTLLADNKDVNDLLSHFFIPAKPSTLSFVDYPHAKADIALLTDILKPALENGEKGVNILLYGTPGTGKTELARLMATSLDCQLFEVKTEDDDGDAIRSNNRLSNYRLSQQLLSKDTQSLILFDEVEDVFPSRSFSFFGLEQKSGENKGWMNKTLEENPTPALWLCNQVQQIDAAFLRRFDYVMELNTPPKSVRLNIVKHYLEDKSVSQVFMERLAMHESLSPAQVSKVSKIASRLPATGENVDQVLEKVVNNSLKAMSLKPLPKIAKDNLTYDVSYLNTNVDIVSMIDGLKQSKRGNICFYGAPGTGKTALAGFIAKSLDMPLLSKKASDILDMYVGGSEKNIANMFAEATAEGAVLVLDEADSLLRDRRGAKQSWEVTQVNELLVQMENFEGLFFCSTNLMDDLDQASLRRFALKVQFNYLSCEQAYRMFEQECEGKIPHHVKKELLVITNLAPGDFSAVKKRLSILGKLSTAHELLFALKEEVAIKEPNKKISIGFTSQ